MSIYKNLYAGLGAGAVAAVAAVLVSLPLESPDDIVFNAASVGFGSIIVGAISGMIWHLSGGDRIANPAYIAGSVALAALVIAVAALAQTQFDDAVYFTIPLALIAVIISIVGTPISASNARLGSWSSGLLVLIAVAMSFALAGQGDQESGSLSLPPPP